MVDMTDDSPAEPDALGATRGLPGLAPWVVVARAAPDTAESAPGPRRVVFTVAAGALLVLIVVGILGVLAARTLAERQSVNDAANTADLLAEAVVQPALQNGISSGDKAAVDSLAQAVGPYVKSSSLVRVKLWSSAGTILYSDEPRLIGRQFKLDTEELDVFSHPRTKAEVSDLDEPENVLERG